MQIFLQSRGTDWSALFCASKPACSCIYRDGRCLTDSGMTQPAPVFFIFSQQPFGFVIRGRYILIMEEKKMIFLILFHPFCTGCIHHGSISQAAHSRIHPQLWTGLFYNVLQIRRRSADLALLIQINHSGNGSFPVSGNASACSRYGPFRCPCCLSDNAVHVQGIPGGRFHTYKGYIMIVDQCPLIVFNDRALYSIVSLLPLAK